MSEAMNQLEMLTARWKQETGAVRETEFNLGLVLRDLNASPKQFKAITGEVGLPLKDAKRMLKAVLPRAEPKPKKVKEDKPSAAVSEDEATVHHVKREEEARVTRIREIIAERKARSKHAETSDQDFVIALDALNEIERLVS